MSHKQYLRSSPALLGMVICTVKLDEENPTFDGLAQETGFGSTKMHALMWLVKGAAACVYMQRNECNKYDLTAAQCF